MDDEVRRPESRSMLRVSMQVLIYGGGVETAADGFRNSRGKCFLSGWANQ